MKIELIEGAPVNNHITLELANDYGVTGQQSLLEHQNEFEKPDFVFHELCLHINGVYIYFCKKQYKKERIIEICSDAPYLQMHFELYGGAAYYTPHHSDDLPIQTNSGEFSFFYLPKLHGNLSSPPCEQAFSVEIEISQQWLMRNFGEELSVLGDFGESIKKNLAAMLGHKCFPITTEISKALYQMYQTTMQGELKKIYLESKLLEIVSLMLYQVNAEKGIKSKFISNDNTERLQEIKTMLAKDLSRSYTIDELASMAFMNRTKLQLYFQMLFGSTINEYVVDLRMKTAHKLLSEISENNLNVESIANRIGYKQYNYFSNVFKKRYGKSPRQFISAARCKSTDLDLN